MIRLIAAREWRGLFLSPLAWTLLAVTQALLAWIFIILVNDFQNAQGRLAGLEHVPAGVTDLVVAPLFRVTAWALLLLTPLLTMRLFSEERRTGTLDLLLSAPVSASQIVLGKYLGVLAFLLGVVALKAGQGVQIRYDGEQGRITNNADANQYLHREYRKGWTL